VAEASRLLEKPVAPIDSVGLQRRARAGMIALAIRGVLMQLTVLGGDVYLRRRLEPSDFGTFAIVQFSLALFLQLGNVGLGSALIRQHEEPSQRQLSSAYILQILVSLVITGILWFAAPLMLKFWPDMSPAGVWVMRALCINLLLSSLRLVPAMLMERGLEFGKLSILDVILNGTYYIAAIALAATGHGVMSLAGAAVTQGVCGVLGAFIMRPWRPSLVLDFSLIKPILRFGVQFQLKNVISFLVGAIAPIYAGRTLGQRQLGFINWGQSTAYFPLKLVEVMARVSFPLYSRLRADPPALARSLERAVVISAMGTLFFAGLGFGLGPNLIRVIYGEKWMPALPIFYIYLAGISIGFLHPLVAPALDALGRPGLNIRLMLSWTIATVILVAITTPLWGMVGFAIGYCIPMVTGNIVVMIILKRIVPNAKFWPRTRALILGGLAIALLGRFVLATWAVKPWSFTLSVLACVAVFFLVVGLLDRSAIDEIRTLIKRKQPAAA
jgi:PST family polysaccharide transporter